MMLVKLADATAASGLRALQPSCAALPISFYQAMLQKIN